MSLRSGFASMFLSIHLLMTSKSVDANSFEKVQYPNGTCACSVEVPDLVVPLEQIFPSFAGVDPCIAPGAICAKRCKEDPKCTAYNYKRDPWICELFYSSSMNCSAVYGCGLGQVIGFHVCRSTDSSTTLTTLTTSTLTTPGIATTLNQETTSPTTTPAVTAPVLPATTTNAPAVQTSTQVPAKVNPTTTATAAAPVVAGTTFMPAPTVGVKISNPCDKLIGPPNMIIHINQGSGLDQPYSAYKYGFSDSNGGYWLGSETVSQLTNNGENWKVCAFGQDFLGMTHYVTYTSFILDPESTGYTYYMNGMSGAPSDPLGPDSRKYKFTAKDANNQPSSCSSTNQAIAAKGGWWYGCSSPQANLNGAGSKGLFWNIPFLGSIPLRVTMIRIGH